MTDLDIGKKAMRVFFEANTRYSGAPQSFDAFYSLYGKKADIYADGLGGAIRVNNLTDRQVTSAMQSLAEKAQGKIPGDHNAYFAAINGEAGKINYLDLTASVAKDVGGAVVDGAVALGDNLQIILKVANFALPFVALYFGYLYVNKKAKKLK